VGQRSTRPERFFLAFDHRRAFAKSVLDGGVGALNEEAASRIRDAKALIYSSVAIILERTGLANGEFGILVDEEYGAGVAVAAKADGVPIAMPVEADERRVFEFAYGEDYRAHVETFDPDFVKVLVRYNADGPRSDNDRQLSRLKELFDWAEETSRRSVFELVVPPLPEQLGGRLIAGQPVGGEDRMDRYERFQRPALIRRAIAEIQAAGISPDIWKLEGIDEQDDADAIGRQALAGANGKDVSCLILGGEASDERLHNRLRVAAAADGFAGFAIGRSIWSAAVRDFLAGSVSGAAAAAEIAERYVELVAVYRESDPSQTGRVSVSSS
jgi:myo-inositol catabolism protein IolC